MIVKKKYISSTYLRNVDKYEYNFYEDKENNKHGNVYCYGGGISVVR